MAHLKDKKHLFFDLDDTLWDFDINSSRVLQILFEEFELDKKLKASAQNFIDKYKEVNLKFWSLYYKSQIDKTYMRRYRFQEVFSHFGYDNFDESLRVSEIYMQQSPQGTALKEDCIQTLDYLQKKYQLHIITNGFTESQFTKINGCGLKPFFQHIIISEEHQSRKPEEKIFRIAEKIAGAETEECVMIGDSLESDIAGALNAGWDVVYFAGNQSDFYKGTTIRRLEELKAIF